LIEVENGVDILQECVSHQPGIGYDRYAVDVTGTLAIDTRTDPVLGRDLISNA